MAKCFFLFFAIQLAFATQVPACEVTSIMGQIAGHVTNPSAESSALNQDLMDSLTGCVVVSKDTITQRMMSVLATQQYNFIKISTTQSDISVACAKAGLLATIDFQTNVTTAAQKCVLDALNKTRDIAAAGNLIVKASQNFGDEIAAAYSCLNAGDSSFQCVSKIISGVVTSLTSYSAALPTLSTQITTLASSILLGTNDCFEKAFNKTVDGIAEITANYKSCIHL